MVTIESIAFMPVEVAVKAMEISYSLATQCEYATDADVRSAFMRNLKDVLAALGYNISDAAIEASLPASLAAA